MNWYKKSQIRDWNNNPVITYINKLDMQVKQKESELANELSILAKQTNMSLDYFNNMPIDNKRKLNGKIYRIYSDLEVLNSEINSIKQQLPSKMPFAVKDKNKKRLDLSDLSKYYPENQRVPEDAWYNFVEQLDNTQNNVLFEYKENINNPNYKQRWSLVPAGRLKKIWTDFSKLGFVRDEKGINQIADIIIENIQKIYTNNILTGHSTVNPERFAEDAFDEKVEDGYFDILNDFFDDDLGIARISDYAIGNLMNNAMQLQNSTRPEDKLLIIDRILNIVHQRSDLSSWFVEGGSETLNEIATASIIMKMLYKFAQQGYLWNNDPKLPFANDILPKNDEWQPSGNLASDLEDAQNPQQVYIVLDAYKNAGVEYEEIDFYGGVKLLKVYEGQNLFLVDPEYPKLQNPKEWLSNINDIWSYIDNGDFNKEYWDGIGNGSVVYHGTRKDNLNSILKNGLNPRDETRGIANRSTGAAVFTSDNPETPANYYDIVLEINVGQMKADGYMPHVSLEEPIEEAKAYELLAWKIGVQDYFHDVEQGLDEGTVIFYGNIPAKYIMVYK